MFDRRKLTTGVCIAVVVLLALTPGASALFCAVLIPLEPLFGTMVSIPAPAPAQDVLPSAPRLQVANLRAPPAA